MKLCIVIPHFDHVDQFTPMLSLLAGDGLPKIVVDDHSPDAVFARLTAAVETFVPGTCLMRLETNRGKGVALQAGLKAARDAGFTHAVQIDADGQHDVAAIAKLASEAERFPHRIVCGQPVYDDRVPVIRFYARYLSLAFNWLETLSLEIRDAQCGFRIYPVRETLAICERARLGSRMDFDPEILVRARWAGLGLRFVPVRVSYPETGASHYRYLRDNLLITWMHIRLIAGMLLRLPRLLARTWAERRSR